MPMRLLLRREVNAHAVLLGGVKGGSKEDLPLRHHSRFLAVRLGQCGFGALGAGALFCQVGEELLNPCFVVLAPLKQLF